MSVAEVNACQNTDRELYREPWPDPPGDFYAPSIHVTAAGKIGINVGGTCFEMPLKAWHQLACDKVWPNGNPSGVESPQREPTETESK